ncbi:unnamed protein product [Malassezia sympodialis ATCC 42132]|uniref:Similar to S.cerevisiae protein YDJ1 (Type I HSP40 co-chaperone) n=1 Tax=Malassezia sympodialis (strain ATCC 42132) TaxID=1230383 RepID=M5E9T1_MALS4|nr:uncharacterized protein MSY001_1906 [Malassezia sympodialis ATCC 42132]CCU99200.1 unnamed protein product [Malassezia sympodialis ATCC 42132]SHO78452.1 Similar to S.cerevisiae protein YDJ1 (Type I HSP40 co-chaperone) [Malassezia sympodialis ATCC 42132]|eukprot:XP_018740462.1 uncharacterized protein MSY001_1906 [Malassezia sympodialis ATCC 42132]
MGTSTERLPDAYELLDVDIDATEAQIRTAYRKKSLQLHPDKVKDVPPDVAADRFHRLTLAYEELLNPATRIRLAQELQQERERRQRRSAFDERRRAMAADLEEREERDRQARAMREQRLRERELRIVALREEGRTMRIQRHERLLNEWQAHAQQETATKSATPESPANLPAWGTLDTTVLVRFPFEQAAEMWGAIEPPESLLDTPLAVSLQDSYGPLVNVRVRTTQKKRKEISVIVVFEYGVHAWRAVHDGMQLRCTHPLLQDCWIGWSDESGKARSDIPQRIAAWMAQGVTPAQAPLTVEPVKTMPHDIAANFDYAYEARTLERMRQAAGMA